MFNIAWTEVSDADVKDAFGEAVNVIGSNVKSVLGGECRLSYPRITTIHCHGEIDDTEAACEFEGDILTVHLNETRTAEAVLC